MNRKYFFKNSKRLEVSILIVLEFINELGISISDVKAEVEFQSLLFWNLSMNKELFENYLIDCKSFNPYCFGIYQ